MPSPGKIFAVTFGISAGGAIIGAAAGARAMLFTMVLSGMAMNLSGLIVLEIPAFFGAIIGAVLTPIAAWMLLRRVALGRALLGLAVGTIAGAVLGWFLLFARDRMMGAILAAVVGFLVAAAVLRWIGGQGVVRAEP